MSEYAVQVNALEKSFGSRAALRSLSVEVPRGAVYGLLGANGAGKSTLLNVLAGLLHPSGGRALVFGHDVAVRDTLAATQIAYVDQAKTLYGYLTVGKTLQLAQGLSPNWSQSLADKYVRVERDRRVGALSQGQRAQLAFALAVARRAPLLLVDEPTANLDPIAAQAMLRGIIDDCVEEGMTVLLCSHQLEEVSQVCSQVAFLKDGSLRHEMSLDELESDYRMITSVQAGTGHPPVPNSVCTRTVNGITRYLVSTGAQDVVARLTAEGVQVLDVQALSLKMLYLECLAEDGA